MRMQMIITGVKRTLPLILLIPCAILLNSSELQAQVNPCDTLAVDETWRISANSEENAFCDTTTLQLVALSDSTYESGILEFLWERKIGAGNFQPFGTDNDTISTTVNSTTEFRCTVSCGNGGNANEVVIQTLIVTITLPTSGTISGNQTICNGGDPAAFTNTTSGTSATTPTVSYQWQSQTGAGAFTDISGANQPTFNPPSGLTQTTSYRRITRSSDDINSQCLSAPTASVTVTVQPVISAGSISGDQSICSGGNPSNLTGTNVTAGSATIAYVWEQASNDVDFTEISGALAASFDPPANTTQTTFYRRITEATLNGVTCVSAATPSVEVSVRALPTSGSISGSQTICFQGDPVVFTSTPATTADGGVISYFWQVNTNTPAFPEGNWTAPASGTGASTATFEEASGLLTANRQYRRFAISTLTAVACTSATATGTVQLTVLPQLTASFTSNTATVCAGATATLTVNGTAGAIVTYTIANGSSQVVLLNGSGTGAISVPTTAAGSIQVELTQIQATSPVTCSRALDLAATVTVIAQPTAAFSAGNSSTHCLASTYTLQLSGTPNADVEYTINGGTNQSATLLPNGSVTITGITLGSGNNTFQLSQVSLGSCSADLSSSFVVNVTSNPSVNVVALNGDDFVICQGESVTLGSSTVGTAYQWFRNGTAVSTSAEFTTTQTGNYTVQVTSSGCGGTSSAITVSSGQEPNVTITASGPTTFCAGGSVTITAAAATCTGCSLLWSTQSVANSIDVAESAVITVTATNNDGCIDVSNTITVVENPLPNVAVSAPTSTLCTGESVTLNATGATTYTWINLDNGQTVGSGASITVTATGTYQATGTSNNCTNSAEAEIEVFPTPALTSIEGPNEICANTSGQIELLGTDDAVVEYRINGGEIQTVTLDGNGEAVLFTNPAFTGNSLVYAVVSISLGNCEGTVSGSASVQINPRPILQSISDVEYCNGQEIDPIDLNETIGSPVAAIGFDWESFPDVLIWDDPALGSIQGEVINNNDDPITTEFIVWGESQDGCVSDSIQFFLTVNPGPSITEISDIILCDGEAWTALTLDAGLNDAEIDWSAIGPDIGLIENGGSSINASEGSVDIPDGGIEPQTKIITVTASAGGCEANPMEFNVTVLPTPVGNTTVSSAFCPNEEVEISFSSTNADAYDWEQTDGESIGLPTGVVSNALSVSFTTSNATEDELPAELTITPKVTLNEGQPNQKTCIGFPQVITVIVNPTPQLEVVSAGSICYQDSVLNDDFEFSFTPQNNVTYNWQVSNTALFATDNGSAPIATQANNSGPNQVTSSIVFTPVYENNGRACEGDEQDAAIIVLPEPTFEIDLNSSDELCSGGTVEFGVSSTTTPSSQWNLTATATNVSGFDASCQNCAIIEDEVQLSGNTPQNLTYTITAFIGSCEGEGQSVEFTVNPLPSIPEVISDESASWCAASQGVTLLADTSVSVSAYDWSIVSGDTAGWTLAYGGNQGGIEGSLAYINVPPGGGTINYALSAENAFGCSRSANLTLTVEPSSVLPDYQVVIVNPESSTPMLAVLPALDGQTYQWGAVDAQSWSSFAFAGQTGQILFLDATFNPDGNYYYVDVVTGDCVSRVFFNSPVSLIPQSVVTLDDQQGMLSVYPNPFTDILRLSRSNATENAVVRVYDSTGRLWHTFNWSTALNETFLHTDDWPAGTYLLQIESAYQNYTTRVIKF